MQWLDGIKASAEGWLETNKKWVLLVGGGFFALLTMANLGAAITIAVILAAVTHALGLWKLDD